MAGPKNCNVNKVEIVDYNVSSTRQLPKDAARCMRGWARPTQIFLTATCLVDA